MVHLSKDLFALILSYLPRAPRLKVVCRDWNEVLQSSTFQRLWEQKHVWEMRFIKVVLIDSPRAAREKFFQFPFDQMSCIPYEGWGYQYGGLNGCEDGMSFLHWKKGKLVKIHDEFTFTMVYINHQGSEWIRKVLYDNEDEVYKIVFHKRPLGTHDDSPLHKKEDEIFTEERFEFRVVGHEKLDLNNFRYILKNGKNVYEVKRGKTFRVKQFRSGTKPGRSRMQVVQERLIPVKYEICVPDWMKEDLEVNEPLFQEIVREV